MSMLTRVRKAFSAPLCGVVIAFTSVMAAIPARADEPPTVSLALRDTAEGWAGDGTSALNKLQISAALDGSAHGLEGWRAHVQVYNLSGAGPSARVGDIQTLSNLDAPAATRLFEAWIEKAYGGDKPWLSLRAGLVDLNADFDSIDAASLFINSSHGIGPDLSRSGLTDPSIYPVTALGLRAVWSPSDRVTLKSAVFDGVAGDPQRPRAFVAERLEARDGALIVAEGDFKVWRQLTLTTGGWTYTRPLQPAFLPGSRPQTDRGVYASLSTPTPRKRGLAGWVRVGVANPDAQVVSGYIGAGVVYKGVGSRDDDRVGLAVARAAIGAPARLENGLPNAETTWEASYQAKLTQAVAVQPDLQYVVHPAGQAGARNALVVGLRVILTAGYPAPAKPEDATDPTVPPDTPSTDTPGP